ncbi:hypothetical protein [Legionella sp. W05-934-2]|jgi:hypothetical protein|uniref:hypothetical protein n=1 Tax=Legionella sp. W05-934-2 TaxID=1198649 RepID=UPI003462EAFD
MTNPERKKTIAGLLFILCAITWILTFWYKDKLPPPSFYAGRDFSAPVQTPSENEPFEINTNEQRYLITPLFFYDLTGVVVSLSNADGFTNIWHHRRWKDFINVRDLCVIWDPNVTSGIYQNLEFSSDSWTCWVTWPDRETSHRFDAYALSNNHLLTTDLIVKKALLSANIGDVVSAKGMLVNYENLSNGMKRSTSTTRTDGGQGACETIYLTDFHVIAKAHPTLRILNKFSFWGMWLTLLEYFYFVFTIPHRARGITPK